MTGPYETEWQALDEPMPQEVQQLHAAGLVRSGDPDHAVRDVVLRHLHAVCETAGVELGEYDRRVLRWIAGYETGLAQVVIGLIDRAAATL